MSDEYPFNKCPNCGCSDVPDWFNDAWEIWDWKCPACGSKFFLTREIVYRVEKINGATKSSDEIEEYFNPELKKKREEEEKEKEKKEYFETLSDARKLGVIGKNMRPKITEFMNLGDGGVMVIVPSSSSRKLLMKKRV